MTKQGLEEIKESLLYDLSGEKRINAEKALDISIKSHGTFGPRYDPLTLEIEEDTVTSEAEKVNDIYLNEVLSIKGFELPTIKKLITESMFSELLGIQVMDGPISHVKSIRKNDKGEIIIDKYLVEVKTHNLETKWVTETKEDISEFSGIDIRNEIRLGMAQEIKAELNAKILNELKHITTRDEFSNTKTVDNPKTDELVDEIANTINEIGKKIGQEKGYWIVVSKNILVKLSEYDKFEKAGGCIDSFVGTLNGSVKVYLDRYTDNDDILVGYKRSDFDAGAFCTPYYFLSSVKRYDENAEDPKKSIYVGFWSRYAFVEMKDKESHNSADYFGRVVVENLDK